MAKIRKTNLPVGYWEKLHRPIDDIYGCAYFGDPETLQEILKVLLHKKDIKLVLVETQKPIVLLGLRRKITLDIYAQDTEGNVFNVELQRQREGATPERARLNRSAIVTMLYSQKQLEAQSTNEKKKARDYPKSKIYVIFLCEEDPERQGKLVYEYPFNHGNGALDCDIFLNCSYRGNAEESPQAMLAHDLLNPYSEEMLLPWMAGRMNWLNETEEGKDFVEDVFQKRIDQIRAEDRKKAQAEKRAAVAEERKKARAEKQAALAEKQAELDEERKKAQTNQIELAKTLLRNGKLALKEIASYLNLPLKIVKSLQAELQGSAQV